jgi:hypothetical protein
MVGGLSGHNDRRFTGTAASVVGVTVPGLTAAGAAHLAGRD